MKNKKKYNCIDDSHVKNCKCSEKGVVICTCNKNEEKSTEIDLNTLKYGDVVELKSGQTVKWLGYFQCIILNHKYKVKYKWLHIIVKNNVLTTKKNLQVKKILGRGYISRSESINKIFTKYIYKHSTFNTQMVWIGKKPKLKKYQKRIDNSLNFRGKVGAYYEHTQKSYALNQFLKQVFNGENPSELLNLFEERTQEFFDNKLNTHANQRVKDTETIKTRYSFLFKDYQKVCLNFIK